jgi:hypothetical protein
MNALGDVEHVALAIVILGAVATIAINGAATASLIKSFTTAFTTSLQGAMS